MGEGGGEHRLATARGCHCLLGRCGSESDPGPWCCSRGGGASQIMVLSHRCARCLPQGSIPFMLMRLVWLDESFLLLKKITRKPRATESSPWSPPTRTVGRAFAFTADHGEHVFCLWLSPQSGMQASFPPVSVGAASCTQTFLVWPEPHVRIRQRARGHPWGDISMRQANPVDHLLLTQFPALGTRSTGVPLTGAPWPGERGDTRLGRAEPVPLHTGRGESKAGLSLPWGWLAPATHFRERDHQVFGGNSFHLSFCGCSGSRNWDVFWGVLSGSTCRDTLPSILRTAHHSRFWAQACLATPQAVGLGYRSPIGVDSSCGGT